jgi:hypothetical protein
LGESPGGGRRESVARVPHKWRKQRFEAAPHSRRMEPPGAPYTPRGERSVRTANGGRGGVVSAESREVAICEDQGEPEKGSARKWQSVRVSGQTANGSARALRPPVRLGGSAARRLSSPERGSRRSQFFRNYAVSESTTRKLLRLSVHRSEVKLSLGIASEMTQSPIQRLRNGTAPDSTAGNWDCSRADILGHAGVSELVCPRSGPERGRPSSGLSKSSATPRFPKSSHF